MTPAIPVATVKVNLHAIIERAVEEGIAFGWRRAHKHVDNPDGGTVCNEIHNAVMNALAEIVTFDTQEA
jgi:hypothetical protein